MVRGVVASVSGTPVGSGSERSVGGYTNGTPEINPKWGIHGLLPALHTNIGWAF